MQQAMPTQGVPRILTFVPVVIAMAPVMVVSVTRQCGMFYGVEFAHEGQHRLAHHP